MDGQKSPQMYSRGFWNHLKNIKGKTVRQRLSRFLFADYRAPYSITGINTAELLLGRKTQSQLDLQVIYHTYHYPSLQQWFQSMGSLLWKEPIWRCGTVICKEGETVATILLDDLNETARRHFDQLRPHTSAQIETPTYENATPSVYIRF